MSETTARPNPIALAEMPQRFAEKVEVDPSGCWTWTASKNPRGYGNFRLEGKTRSAHRVAFEISGGSVDDGFELDHLCRNRACVNPEHLEVVTHAENCRRSANGYELTGKCQSGLHEMTDENVAVRQDGRGRECKRCKYESNRLGRIRRSKESA